MQSMDKTIKTNSKLLNKTWKILQQAKMVLAKNKIMPQYQKYLTLREEIHATFPFKKFYTLSYGSWPKDLNEDILMA
jgi:hypothetical protein